MQRFLVPLALLISASVGAGRTLASPLSVLPAPVPASLEQILDNRPSDWRSSSLEEYRWDLFPDVLIFDTASFAVQDRMFTRLAYFLEKRGFKGRLLGNARLAGRHGWNAHDYGAEGLAAFYSAALRTGFTLNPEELAVRQMAIAEGIIAASRGEYFPGRGGVLSISRSSSSIERRLLLTHESFHGIFFSSEAYRNFCFDFWNSLPAAQRAFYLGFLDSLGYETSDSTLTVNEFQAYLMQQPLEYAAGYFERFIGGQPPAGASVTPAELAEDARTLSDFLAPRFGFGAGGPLLASLAGDAAR